MSADSAMAMLRLNILPKSDAGADYLHRCGPDARTTAGQETSATLRDTAPIDLGGAREETEGIEKAGSEHGD